MGKKDQESDALPISQEERIYRTVRGLKKVDICDGITIFDISGYTHLVETALYIKAGLLDPDYEYYLTSAIRSLVASIHYAHNGDRDARRRLNAIRPLLETRKNITVELDAILKKSKPSKPEIHGQKLLQWVEYFRPIIQPVPFRKLMDCEGVTGRFWLEGSYYCPEVRVLHNENVRLIQRPPIEDGGKYALAKDLAPNTRITTLQSLARAAYGKEQGEAKIDADNMDKYLKRYIESTEKNWISMMFLATGGVDCFEKTLGRPHPFLIKKREEKRGVKSA